jgi:hypothetical protein
MGKNVNILNVINLTQAPRAFLCGEAHKNTLVISLLQRIHTTQ